MLVLVRIRVRIKKADRAVQNVIDVKDQVTFKILLVVEC